MREGLESIEGAGSSWGITVRNSSGMPGFCLAEEAAWTGEVEWNGDCVLPFPDELLRQDMTGIVAVEATERFTVEITESGMDITGNEGESLRFSALDALMLLDILKSEEANLRKAADEASPLPVSIHP